MILIPSRRRAGAWALLLLAGGCASPLQVRPLATGQVDQPGYELRGAQLAQLQREAERLCPGGAEVLRQAHAEQRAERGEPGGRLQRWAQQAGDWIDPPQRQAQMMVVCRQPAADAGQPSAPTAPQGPPGMAGTKAATTAGLPRRPPIGPLMIEW